MGSAIIERGATYECDGNDVITQLNKVFGDPDCDEYKYAQSHNKFGGVPNADGNWKALRDAYNFAFEKGKVNPGWESYLEFLGTVSAEGPQQGPQNIYDIAQFRYNGLIDKVPMKTKTHAPHHGGHVHHGAKAGIAPGTIDSPCPMPQPPTKKY